MAVLTAVQSGRWTDPTTWDAGRTPTTGDCVVIPAGITVFYDVLEGSGYDVSLGSSGSDIAVDIYGTLQFIDTEPLSTRLVMRLTGKIYVRENGKLLVGTRYNAELGFQEAPIQNPVYFDCAYSEAGKIHPCANSIISIYGTPNCPPDGQGGYKIWTRLAAQANSGASSIVVQDDLNWQVNDVIALPGPYMHRVTAVTRNQNGTVTLTLSPTLARLFVAGVHVIKINRSIVFKHTSSAIVWPWFGQQFGSGYWYLAALSWVTFGRDDAKGEWWFTTAPWLLCLIEYVSGYTQDLRANYGTFASSFPSGIGKVRRCFLLLPSTLPREPFPYTPVDYEECVLWLASSGADNYLPNRLKSCVLLSSRFVGGTMYYLDGCTVYWPTWSGDAAVATIVFRNCEIWGLDVALLRIRVFFIGCSFRTAPDGTGINLRWTYDTSWGERWDSSRWCPEFWNCQFYTNPNYEKLRSPNRFTAASPIPVFRFVDCVDYYNNVTYREWIFKNSGIIKSDETDIPNELSVSYSYRFTVGGAYQPLFHDLLTIPPLESAKVAIKRLHSGCVVRVQLIYEKDALTLIRGTEMFYEPVFEQVIDNSPVNEWYVVTVQNQLSTHPLRLRVVVYASASSQEVKVAAQLLTGSGASGGEAGGTVYNIVVNDGITAVLQDAVNADISISVSDAINAGLSDQASVAASIAVAESISASLQDSAQSSVSVSIQDNINAMLSDEASASIAVTVQDNTQASMLEATSASVLTHVQDSIVAAIEDVAQTEVSISAQDVISPVLADEMSMDVSFVVQDTTMAAVTEAVLAEANVSVQDIVSSTFADEAAAGFEVSVQDVTSAVIADQATAGVNVLVQDSIEAVLQDQAAISVDVSAEERTEVIAEDSANITSGTTYFISISDSVEATLSDEASMQVNVSAQERTGVTLQDAADVSSGTTYFITVSDSVEATFSDEANLSVGIRASDQIAARLQDQANVEVSLNASDTIAATVQDQTEVIIVIDVDETTAATLQDAASVGVSISTSDSVQARLQDQASTVISISATDETDVSMQEGVGMDVSLAVTEETRVVASDQAGVTVEARVSETTPVKMDEHLTAITATGMSFIYEPIDVVIREKAQLDVAISIDRIEVIVDVD